MKIKHSSIRLDEATSAIVARYEEQFGVSTNETIARLIQAADGKNFVTVLSTAASHREELSFFAGQLEKNRLHWRGIKSRLNAPRPIEPDDEAALNQWRDDRARIGKFYEDCNALWRHSFALSAIMTGMTIEELKDLQAVAYWVAYWAKEWEQRAAKAATQKEKETLLETKLVYERVVEAFHRLGIEPMSPEESAARDQVPA